MLKLPHSIRRQTLEVDVDSEAMAMVLQPRIAEINRRHFLPVIERVLDELAVAGDRLKITRIDVDLGSFAFNGFEESAAERLYHELRNTLEPLLGKDRPAGSKDCRSQPEETTLVELLESYLVRGTLPFWAPRGSTLSLEELTARIMDADSACIAGLIRDNAARPFVLERLVLQLDDAMLAKILSLLDPDHASLIVAYLFDLKRVHSAEPLLSLSDREFSRLLWILALAYLVQDAGSQFNRKSFVRSLLEGIARSEGLDYAGILETLRSGLEMTGARISLKSSLPAVIGELVKEWDSAIGEAPDSRAATAATDRSPMRLDEPGLDADELDRETLIRIIRAHVSNGGELERLVTEAGEAVLRRLLQRLDPENTELIIAYMTDLKEVQRVEHVPPMSRDRLVRLLWSLVLAYEVSDPGSQFNRRSFVKSLLEGVAESEGFAYEEIVEALRLGLMETEKKASIRSSLPAVLRELFHEIHEDADRAPEERAAHRHTAPPGRGASPPYDDFETIRYYLTHGILPWSALLRNPDLTAEIALMPLMRLSLSQLRALFSQETAEDRRLALRRATAVLPEDALSSFVARFLEHNGAPLEAFLDGLTRFAREAEDKRSFHALVVSAALDGMPLDLEAIAACAAETPFENRISGSAPVNWKPHLIKSAIAARIRPGAVSSPDEQPLGDLINALAARHPHDARHFFYAVRDVEALSSAIVDQCHASLFEDVLEFLRPAEVEALGALTRAIEGIPSPYRPASSARVRQALLLELIGLGEGRPLGESFFLGVIRRLFATPLSEWLSNFLLNEAAAWGNGEGSLSEHASVFERGVRAAGVRANGEAHDDARAAREIQSESTHRASGLLDAIFGFLLGKTIEQGDFAEASAAARKPINVISSDALLHALLMLLDESPEALRSFIAREVVEPRTREHWARVLPESVLVRISYLLAPRNHRVLMDSAELLASAWIEAAAPGHPTLTARRELWVFLLEFFSKSRSGEPSLKRLAGALFDHYAARYEAASPSAPDRATVGTRLLDRSRRLAAAGGRAALLGVLQGDRAALLESWNRGFAADRPAAGPSNRGDSIGRIRSERPEGRRGKTRFRLGEESSYSEGEPIYIGNAGLVLAGPFLPQMFRAFDWLKHEEGGLVSLDDRDAITRGVHLLQFLVDGSTTTPEPLLVLNKLLCGVPPGSPVEPSIEPTPEELEICERVLRSMLGNWKAIENTSIAGLRETFLQREGRLDGSDDAWRLRVQRKTVDVLIDQVPWSVSVVYHPWMSKPIHVTW